MPRPRKNHPPSLKAKVALEALKGLKTASEIGQSFSVHPNLVAIWKKNFLHDLTNLRRTLPRFHVAFTIL